VKDQSRRLIADAGLGPTLPLLHWLRFTVLLCRPRTVSTAMHALRWSLAHTPRLAGHLSTWRAARPDRRLIRRPEVGPRLLRSFSEGLRPPGTAGPNIDLGIFGRPWNIDLDRIGAPARL